MYFLKYLYLFSFLFHLFSLSLQCQNKNVKLLIFKRMKKMIQLLTRRDALRNLTAVVLGAACVMAVLCLLGPEFIIGMLFAGALIDK